MSNQTHVITSKHAGSRYFTCHECKAVDTDVHFNTLSEINAHLKEAHPRWYMEYSCRYGMKCHGAHSGGCGFNHASYSCATEPKYVEDLTNIPPSICRYDRPWEGKRCKRAKCKFDHFWNRVKYMIEMDKLVDKVSKKSEEVEKAFCKPFSVFEKKEEAPLKVFM